MILIDTSIWIDHLRSHDAILEALLQEEQVLLHPFVIGEIALGSMRDHDVISNGLLRLDQAEIAEPGEFLSLVRQYSLQGRGIGFVDAHLIATAKLKQPAKVWTRDKRLAKVAHMLGIAYEP